MSRVLILDTGPLGMVTHPGSGQQVEACKKWLLEVLSGGTQVIVPEIADYELRRELLRAGKTESVDRLDALTATLNYLPITTAAMRRAAEFRADLRRKGRPTAESAALDGEVILAAQALRAGLSPDRVVVATTNPGHLSLMVQAENWESIE